MNRTSHHAFTLIEVLIAVSLAGVVTAVALLLLHTTFQVTEEVRSPLFTEEDTFRQALQTELDHLLVRPPFEDQPPLELSGEEGLTLVSLLPDDRGIPQATRVQYRLEGTALLRIAERALLPTATTNLLFQSVQRFSVTAVQEGRVEEEWPPEKESGPPARIQMELKRYNRESFESTWDIPAAFRIETETID